MKFRAFNFRFSLKTKKILGQPVIKMTKWIFLMTLLLITMEGVQLQRSPYAGSANRFRGQPMNLAPAIPSVSSVASSSSVIGTEARSFDTQTTTTTTAKPLTNGIQIPQRINGFDSNERVPNRNDYQNHHRHHQHDNYWHDHRGQRHFDYDFFKK